MYMYIVNNFTLVLGVAKCSFDTCFAGQPSPVMARQRQHDLFSFKGRLSHKGRLNVYWYVHMVHAPSAWFPLTPPMSMVSFGPRTREREL